MNDRALGRASGVYLLREGGEEKGKSESRPAKIARPAGEARRPERSALLGFNTFRRRNFYDTARRHVFARPEFPRVECRLARE